MKNFSKLFCLAMLSVFLVFSLSGCKQKAVTQTAEDTQQKEVKPTPAASDNSKDADSIVIGIPQDLDSLDPHYAKGAGTREVLFNIYEGLLKPLPNGNLECALASDYEIQDEGLKYVFTLRDGVKFHDGTPVTAQDVVFSLKRCAGDNGGEILIPVFSYIDEITSEDNKIIITLNQKHPEILYSLNVAIIPEHVIKDGNMTAYIGTGPYKIDKREVQNYLDVVRNDDYYNEPAFIKNVRFKVIADSNMIATELKSGSIDMFSRITDVQAEEAQETCNILQGSMNLVQALYLNNAQKPFDDVRVRKALCYAVDKYKILELVFAAKGHIIGSSMVPSFKKYYMPELEDAYPYNPQKAKELLKEAGYENGFDMEITVPSNYQQHVDTAQVIVEQLKEVGINATIKPVEWATWLSDVYTDRNYQSTVVGVDATTMSASAFLSRFTSDAGNNFINFNDEEYDEKFNEAQEYEDLDEQAAIYQECEQILSDRAANVYIQDMTSFVALNKRFTGYEFYPIYVIDAAKLKPVS